MNTRNIRFRNTIYNEILELYPEESLMIKYSNLQLIFNDSELGLDKNIRSKIRNLSNGLDIMFDSDDDIYYFNPNGNPYLIDIKKVTKSYTRIECFNCPIYNKIHTHLVPPKMDQSIFGNILQDHLINDINTYIPSTEYCDFNHLTKWSMDEINNSIHAEISIKNFVVYDLFKKWLILLKKSNIIELKIINALFLIGTKIWEFQNDLLLLFLNNIQDEIFGDLL